MSIDPTKLSRDYHKFPITRKCGPTKEDMEYVFYSGLKVEEMVSIFNTTIWTFYKWLNKFGIQRKQGSATDALSSKVDYTKLARDYRVSPLKYMEAPPREDLDYLYNTVKLTREEISQVFGRGNTARFADRWLSRLGVVRKREEKPVDLRDSNTKKQDTNLVKFGVPWYQQKDIPPNVLAILSNKSALEELYKRRSMMEVGKILGVSDVTVCHYIRKHGIPVHKYKESSPERQLKKCLPGVTLKTDRTVLAPQEIDLFAPEFKIGIEYNGNYWHSELKKESTYHQKKSLRAEAKGIFLFHIFEHEWEDERTRLAILGRLHNLFHQSIAKIFARKCEIREVPQKEANEFLNKYHVQGKARAEVRFGLYYDNELVSLMEFTKVTLNKNCDWELIRFCGKWDTNVVGAASRLFKHFLRTYNPKQVVSYSDFAKTTGGVYKTLGFTYQYLTPPQYVWVKDHNYLSRYQTQRKRLIAAGLMEKGDTRSEADVMKALGYYKLYDCGKKVWYYKNS